MAESGGRNVVSGGTYLLAPADLAAWARVIRARGYAGFATQLAARLDLESAPLERTRLQLLISVASEFDRQPGGNALRFDAFVRGQEIPAGTFIMTGGVTEAITVNPGDNVNVRFQDLGSVSMRFV